MSFIDSNYAFNFELLNLAAIGEMVKHIGVKDIEIVGMPVSEIIKKIYNGGL